MQGMQGTNPVAAKLTDGIGNTANAGIFTVHAVVDTNAIVGAVE